MTRKLQKLTLASLFLAPALALAAVPGTVAFSARIADGGRPVTGSQSFTFKLWTVETGGTAGVEDVWTEGPRGITVSDGVVSTALGDPANGAPALAPFFTGADLFLEVTMGSTVFPRFKIQSVPYAMRAGVADSAPWSGITGVPGGFADGVDNTGSGTLSCVTQSLTVAIPAALNGSVGAQVFCPATHTTVIGGGWWSSGSNVFVYDNGPYNFGTGDYWFTGVRNSTAVGGSLIVYARCCRVQ